MFGLNIKITLLIIVLSLSFTTKVSTQLSAGTSKWAAGGRFKIGHPRTVYFKDSFLDLPTFCSLCVLLQFPCGDRA